MISLSSLTNDELIRFLRDDEDPKVTELVKRLDASNEVSRKCCRGIWQSPEVNHNKEKEPC